MFDKDKLLLPINAEQPCGEDPEYETLFMEMEQAREGEPERYDITGSLPTDNSGPDWQKTQKLALQLFETSRDLRVATRLCMASLHTQGFTGLRDSLELMRGLLTTFWECLHPELDNEDSNPALMRSNSLMELSAHEFVISLKKQVLFESALFGKFSISSLQAALRYKDSRDKDEKQKYQQAEASFIELAEKPEVLPEILAVLQDCQQHIKAINEIFADKVGHINAPDLAPLQKALSEACHLIEPRLPAPQPEANLTDEPNEAGAPLETDVTNPPPATTRATVSNDEAMNIQNRAHVIEAIDKICTYYQSHEPGSPVPLLLQRARNLVDKDFIEILKDLSPESTAQVEHLLGITPEDN